MTADGRGVGRQLHCATRRCRLVLSEAESHAGKGVGGMAIRAVRVLPDAVLTSPARTLGRIDDRARALAVDLLDTMRASPACVGLAATQIGVPLRAFAIDVTGHKKARSCHGEVVLFDPEIIAFASPRRAARDV